MTISRLPSHPSSVPAAATSGLQSTTPPAARARALGALLIAEGLLALAPMAILGPAIGWPASLDQPAGQQLAAIVAAPGAVAAGYGVYLLYSILIAPVMIMLAARLRGGLASPLGMTVAAFASLSALARAIGILRWLTVMPGLAVSYASADAAARSQIERLFDALTTYGGGVGEVLGVSLFMALSLGALAMGALRGGGLPTWAAILGLASASALGVLLLPLFGAPEVVPVALAVSLVSVWMIALGLRCLWGGPLP